MSSLLYLSQTTSTNDFIVDLASADLGELTGVYTFRQTKGRGQYGNRWESSADQNIAYSFIVPSQAIYLSGKMFNFYTALLVADFIAKISDYRAEVKWPNDIILKNKKIIGILLEKKKLKNIEFYIVGIGINVLQEKFEKYSHAGSLKSITGQSFDLHELTNKLHQHLAFSLFKNISEKQVLNDYNKCLFRKDMVSVFEYKNSRRNGIIRLVDSDGKLNVELEGETDLQKFYHKEIKLLY